MTPALKDAIWAAGMQQLLAEKQATTITRAA